MSALLSVRAVASARYSAAVPAGLLRASVAVAVLALSLVTSTACTIVVTGAVPAAESEAPTGGSGPGFVEPPRDIVGRRLEAHRLAGFTALVLTVFPERTTDCRPSPGYGTAAEMEPAIVREGSAAILDRYGFVAGWAQCNQDAAGTVTVTLSMELSDPASTAAAAESLAAATAADAGAQRITAPGGNPATLLTEDGVERVDIWAPVGRVLAFTVHQAPPGQALDGAQRMSAEQVRLLAGFVPTPQSQVASLPLDPGGLARFALDPPGVRQPASGPFDPEAYLRLAIDPFREREVLTANGFTGMYLKASKEGSLFYAVSVYGFPSAVQTNVVHRQFTALDTIAYDGVAFTLPALPAAPCILVDNGEPAGQYTQRCYVGSGGHLATVDVIGLSDPDDYTMMSALLPAQSDLLTD